MRNGNIAVGIGLFVVALLAATGKLQQLWTAIMNAEMPMENVGTAKVDTSTLFPSPAAGGSGVAPSSGGSSPPTNAKAATWNAITGKAPGAQNVSLIPGADAALEDVYAKWPAGHQTEWNAFLDCYRSTGSVLVCAQHGLVLSTEGRG
jgi:hypothetical protein